MTRNRLRRFASAVVERRAGPGLVPTLARRGDRRCAGRHVRNDSGLDHAPWAGDHGAGADRDDRQPACRCRRRPPAPVTLVDAGCPGGRCPARPGELSPQVDRGDGPATWAVEPRPRFEETDNLAESDVAVNVTSRRPASLAGDIGRANLLARRRWIRAQEPGPTWLARDNRGVRPAVSSGGGSGWR